MPSRPLIAAIVLFWLGMAGWYIAREVVPRWGIGDVPPIHIDLTDEVGNPSISWKVFNKDKLAGRMITQTRRVDADTFELKSELRATDLKLLGGFVELDIRKLDERYRITRAGQLRDIKIDCTVRLSGIDFPMSVAGEIEGDLWVPSLMVAGKKQEIAGLKGVKLAAGGNILNPMRPLNKIPGLTPGQRWRIPMLNPVGDVSRWMKDKNVLVEELEAEVSADTLSWNNDEVACFKIEYRQAGRPEVKARTWVRRADSIVLQQEANFELMALVLVREPSPN